MQVIINIPNWLYHAIQEHRELIYSQSLGEAVRDGTPLLKGHGRILVVSEDIIKREQIPLSFSCQSWISEVGLSNATIAIIEADKTESEANNG